MENKNNMIGNHENASKIVYPANKPMDPRKTFVNSPIVYDSLMFLDFNASDHCILGTSQLSDTLWEGSVLYFDNLKHIPEFDYSCYYLGPTVSDGKFLTENTMVFAEDSGFINVASLDEDNKIRSINYFRVSGPIPQICVWKDKKRILSCSGRTLSVWNADSLDRKPVEIFENYHLDYVNCVDVLKRDSNVFLSGGRDRLACIWDMRNIEPVSVLYKNGFSAITSIAWDQDDNNYIVAGTQAGDVYLLDKRETDSFVAVVHCLDAPINRIQLYKSSHVAVCGDSNKIVVLKKHQLFKNHKIYNDHKGYVKDIKWLNGNLYSCGFERSFLTHSNVISS